MSFPILTEPIYSVRWLDTVPYINQELEMIARNSILVPLKATINDYRDSLPSYINCSKCNERLDKWTSSKSYDGEGSVYIEPNKIVQRICSECNTPLTWMKLTK